MTPEQRYCVPLTLEEMEALLNSHTHDAKTRQYHSSAIAMIDDVLENCQHVPSVSPVYQIVGNRFYSKGRAFQFYPFMGIDSDVFGLLNFYRFLMLDCSFSNVVYALACILPSDENVIISNNPSRM
jgi:hypothetical protein